MAVKPQDTKHIVMSVPHSGTRTLQTYLSENRPEIVPELADQVGHWHFNFHPHYVSKFFLYAADKQDGRMAYIPLRNPYDVIDSWNRRYGPAVDKQVDNNIGPAYGLMTSVIDNHADYVEVFKMEDLPVIRGIGPRPEGWDKEATLKSKRLQDFKRWMPEEVEALLRTYYTAEELWWL